MPFYRFHCKNCKRDEKKLMSFEKAEQYSGACPLCGEPLIQVLGEPNTSALETRDEYRGVKTNTDLKDQLDERAREHFLKHDLPRIIEENGKEYAIRQGFIDEEGNVKK